MSGTRMPFSVFTTGSGLDADIVFRCFLFLVNYSRMKPEVALKALPILVDVWPQYRKNKSCGLELTGCATGYGR